MAVTKSTGGAVGLTDQADTGTGVVCCHQVASRRSLRLGPGGPMRSSSRRAPARLTFDDGLVIEFEQGELTIYPYSLRRAAAPELVEGHGGDVWSEHPLIVSVAHGARVLDFAGPRLPMTGRSSIQQINDGPYGEGWASRVAPWRAGIAAQETVASRFSAPAELGCSARQGRAANRARRRGAGSVRPARRSPPDPVGQHRSCRPSPERTPRSRLAR